MRSFTVAAVAHAIDVEPKWLDNLLSQHEIPDTVHVQRGVTRLIGLRGALAAAIIARLAREAQVPVKVAARLARQAVLDDSPVAAISLADDIELRISVDEIRREVELRLGDAVETVASPARGRPPKPAA